MPVAADVSERDGDLPMALVVSGALCFLLSFGSWLVALGASWAAVICWLDRRDGLASQAAVRWAFRLGAVFLLLGFVLQPVPLTS